MTEVATVPRPGSGSGGGDGVGVPAGGTEDQVLAKASGTDYDTEWSTLPTVPSASVNTVAATGATETLAFATDPTTIVHDMTMDEDCEFSFSSAPSSGNAGSMTVIVRGAFTPTWPGSVDWSGGTEPTYAAPSVYEFLTVDGGTTTLGFLAGAGMS